MQSTLYQRAFEKGRAEVTKEMTRRLLTRVLARRLGYIDPEVQARIEAENNLVMLELWEDLAWGAPDEAAARRLADQIREAPRPQEPC